MSAFGNISRGSAGKGHVLFLRLSWISDVSDFGRLGFQTYRISDKGKPTERWRRKVSGLTKPQAFKTAGLPESSLQAASVRVRHLVGGGGRAHVESVTECAVSACRRFRARAGRRHLSAADERSGRAGPGSQIGCAVDCRGAEPAPGAAAVSVGYAPRRLRGARQGRDTAARRRADPDRWPARR